MSMYKVYIDGLELPWGVPKLTTIIKNRNKEVELINGEVISRPRSPGLTTWKFEAILPEADKYLDKFEDLKLNKKPFRFIVNRGSGNLKEVPNPDYKEKPNPNYKEGGTEPKNIPVDDKIPKTITLYEESNKGNNHSTNVVVTLEDYEREENSTYATMSKVTLTLKEYRNFTTSYVNVEVPKYVEDKIEKHILVTWTEKRRLEKLNLPKEVVARIRYQYAEFDIEGVHYKELISKNYASWKDVTTEVFGDDKYWEEVRDTNAELRWDKHDPSYYGIVKKYPGNLYPIPESTIKIDIETIVDKYYAKIGKTTATEVFYE